MKKLITGALAVTLLASTASGAFAQDQGRHGRGGGERSDDNGGGHGRGQRSGGARHDDGGQRQAAPAPQPQVQQQAQPAPQREYNPGVRRGRGNWPGEAQQAQPAPEARQAPPAPPAPRVEEPRRSGGDRNWRDDGRRDDNRAGDDRRGDDRRWDGDRRGDDRRTDDRRWDDRRWGDNRYNDRDRPRYDRRNYPSVWRTPQRYRGPAYRPPSGWYARSWSYGQIVPRGWYGSQYRLMEWWDYGLPIPPIGYVWDRVGDDALLVDEYSGRIVQVVYDLFW